ncbi:MAG TPA: hypothetical protein VHR36_01340 [Pyrinomonadaceae bacterium]|jgi:hypothetical protein|nr:hypothetical protein [Pyrinomonadaceae bacterium]
MSRTPGFSGLKKFVILWPLFFLICGSLGYPSLRRFDPRVTPGLTDTIKYHALTTGADQSAYAERFRGRVLVPYVARPFYWFAQAYIPTWDAAFFGLLVSAAIFCATTACLIVSLGERVFGDATIGMMGALLYLLNFAVSNSQLAGMIDAGEACFMTAVVWSLLQDKWWLLPLWGLLGTAAKETFVPFSSLFALTWWFVEWRRGKAPLLKVKWVIGLAVVGLAVVIAIHSRIAGHLQWPWQIAEQVNAGTNPLMSLWKIISDQSFWYVLVWLLPLGIWRLKDFPNAWVSASVATAILALLFGIFADSLGNAGRAIFDVAGPLLSLSVAVFLVRLFEASGKVKAYEGS